MNAQLTAIFTLLFTSVSVIWGQTHPDFPSVDEAYNLVKTRYLPNNKEVYQTDYGVTDMSKVIVHKKWYQYDGSEAASYFSAYSSQFMEELFPYADPLPLDRCEIIFTVQTPKNKDGVYYEIPVVVVYQRLKNDVLTNTWELKWFDPQPPIIYGEKVLSASEKVALVVSQSLSLMNSEGTSYATIKLANGAEAYADELENYYRIDSISYTGENVISTTSRTWYFAIYGYKYTNIDLTKSLEKADIVFAKTNFETTVDKINGTWQVQSISIRSSNYGDHEEFGATEYLGMASEVGFKGVYLQTTKYNPHFENAFVRNAFLSNLSRDILALGDNEEDNIKLLSAYFNPNKNQKELAQIIISTVQNLKQKLVTMTEVDVTYTRDDRAYTNYVFTIRIRGSRENCNKPEFKSLKGKYKSAGMSAEEIKRGGEYWGNTYIHFKGLLINNLMVLDEQVIDHPQQSDPIGW